MKVTEIFPLERIVINLRSTTKNQVFDELVETLVKVVPGLEKKAILEGLWDRENKMTTGIARSIALPHTHVHNLETTIGVLGICQKGIDYGSLDGKPVQIIMMLLGNENDPNGHIMVLKNLAMLITNPEFIPKILDCRTAEEVWKAIGDFETKATMFFS